MRLLGAQPRERRFQLQRLVDRLLDELLDRRLAPGSERAPAEAAGEPLDAGEADPVHLDGVAVEHLMPASTRICADLVLLARLVVVVAQHGRRSAP